MSNWFYCLEIYSGNDVIKESGIYPNYDDELNKLAATDDPREAYNFIIGGFKARFPSARIVLTAFHKM